MSEVKLTKPEVEAHVVNMLQQVEYFQNVLEDWPEDAKFIVVNTKENNDEETKG